MLATALQQGLVCLAKRCLKMLGPKEGFWGAVALEVLGWWQGQQRVLLDDHLFLQCNGHLAHAGHVCQAQGFKGRC